VVRGQYRAGIVDGKAGAGLPRGGQGAAGSRTETFVALRTEVQNWRWAGVPFYLRTGKRLAARDAQIVVNFRPTPHAIFPGVSRPNKLVIKLQPETASSCTCSPPRARASPRRWCRSRSTSTSTRPSPRTASAPTSGCCST
jgi:glucose-6-phosphate 1-dehydrogenase